MFAHLEILRPVNLFIVIFAILVTSFLIGFYDISQIAIAIIVAFLVTGAGNTINDYFDYKIDKINKPKRPIPSGRIKRKSALFYFISLILIANFLAIFLHPYCLFLVLFNSFLAFVYAWKLKQKALLGNLIVSWLTGSVFLFASLLTGTITPLILLLFLMAFSVNVSREIAKDIEDMKGDERVGLKTLPIIAGRNVTILITIIFLFFGILSSFLPYILGFLGIYYLYLVIIADIIFGFSAFLLFFSVKNSQKIMKLAMFIAIIAFLIGGI